MSYDGYRQGGPYRSRKPMICGVCRGVAEHFDISIFWTRVFTFLVFWFTGIFPVALVYLCLALLMKREPLLPTGYDPAWHERLKQGRRRPAGSLNERMTRVQQAARG